MIKVFWESRLSHTQKQERRAHMCSFEWVKVWPEQRVEEQ